MAGQNVPQDQAAPDISTSTPAPGRMPTTVPYGDPGIGGVSFPATQSMDINDYLKAVQTIAKPMTPGATVPYARQTDPQALHPRMPVPPTMVPMQSTAQMPVDSSLEERRRARSRSWGATIGNMIGTVANAKMQEKYQGKVSAIQDYADAQIEAQKNQRIMNYYKNDPNNPAFQDAKAGLASANRTILNIQQGKNWNDVEKAYKNYEQGKIDPQQMDEDGNAYREGLGKAIAADGRDTRTDNRANAIDAGRVPQPAPQGFGPGATQGQQLTPQEKEAQVQGLGRRPLPVTSPTTGQPAMGPQATQRAMAERRLGGDPRDPNFRPAIQLPQQMGMNPEYEAQQKYEQAVGMAVLRSVIPSVVRSQSAEYKADKDAASRAYVAETKANADIAREDIRAKNRLDQQSMKDATSIHDTQLRVNGLITKAGMVTDPRQAALLGIASSQQGKMIEKDINDSVGQVSRLQATITKQRSDAQLAYNTGQKESGDRISDEIKVNQREMEILGKHIDKMNDLRDKLMEGTASLPSVAGANPAAGGQDLLGIALGQGGAGGAGAAPASAAEYDPKGGYQQWMPMVEQMRTSQFPNVPPALPQTLLMIENRRGDPRANPQPANPAKGILQGGQGAFQLIPTNQTKYMRQGADPYDPQENTYGALNMMSDSLRRNNGDIRKTLIDWAPKDRSGKPDMAYVNYAYNLYQQVAAAQSGQPPSSDTSSETPTHGAATERYRQQATPQAAAPSTQAAPSAPASQDEIPAIKELVKKLGGL